MSDPNNQSADRKIQLLESLFNLLNKVSAKSLVLLLLFVIFGGITFAVWEQRAILVPQIINSTSSLVSLAVVAILAVIALLLTSMYSQLKESMQMQVNDLKAQVQHANERADAAMAKHDECQANVLRLTLLVAQLRPTGSHDPSA